MARFDEADDVVARIIEATRWPRSRIQVGLVDTPENRVLIESVLQRAEWPPLTGFDLVEGENRHDAIFVLIICRDETVLREVAEIMLLRLCMCFPDVEVNFSNNV